MSALATLQWCGSGGQLAQALAAARSVQTVANAHVTALLPPVVRQRATPRLFAAVDRPYASFSSWWHRVTRGLRQLSELPGLSSLHASMPAGTGSNSLPP